MRQYLRLEILLGPTLQLTIYPAFTSLLLETIVPLPPGYVTVSPILAAPIPSALTFPDADDIFPVPQCGQLCVTASPSRAMPAPLAFALPLAADITPVTA
jgi:hypothetical protein